MEHTDIGPRMFGDRLGYNHAVLVENPRRWLFVAGHEARGDDGAIAHPGDIRAQIKLTFQRLQETLKEAGFTLGDVIQIRILTLDIEAVTTHYDAVTEALARANCRPASLLAQVSALSDPRTLIEIEAIAVQ
ncbi:Rid family hydrolase [Streptomyces yunnanensis]|uniref:Enamine deaminase RidA, house cleaning of reactive enamine intermediates, YjgF/YER057c/UK114 family n=1 Tax=Streptomyces yunnanensis TaxID=156453 RepID=A0A9X8QUM7_9ACTN|nr:Rid family hydrolase [Streptomyces yunnanensis]SHM24062.1 Enamine deaminase RidA, house cleaning of reactive enamine intermediates, YjgF/YER057c/UK114 family [Streptomyces yunnanensis]